MVVVGSCQHAVLVSSMGEGTEEREQEQRRDAGYGPRPKAASAVVESFIAGMLPQDNHGINRTTTTSAMATKANAAGTEYVLAMAARRLHRSTGSICGMWRSNEKELKMCQQKMQRPK